MDELLKLLEEFENSDFQHKEEGNYIYTKELPKELTEKLYDELSESPRPSSIKTEILWRNGYNLYAGESDSFGWLSACITTAKGTIVFG